MNGTAKNILKALHIYHPLQTRYREILSRNKRKIYQKKYAAFRGSGYTCNCCGAVYQKFVPDHPAPENTAALSKYKVIAGYGENILCPSCLSTARERLVVAMLKDRFNIVGKRILHLSPDKNIHAFLKQHAKVISTDPVPGFYKSIDPNVYAQDLNHLIFSSNYFDLVIGNHIMEHIPNDAQAMKEIFRVLKPGGRAILQVPFSESIDHTLEDPSIHDRAKQSALYGQKDHVRIYALADYLQRLQNIGFKTELIPYSSLSHYYNNAIQEGEHFISILKPGV